MRVFDIQNGGKFREFVRTPFQMEHEEKVLEDWLEANPDGIVEDGTLLVIGRQVATNFSGFIDLLALDREGDLVVVELKRHRTPRDTVAQALEYASFAEDLDAEQLERILRSYLDDESLSLAEHHRAYFQLGPDEAIAFNKDQRIVLVGQTIAPETRQTASFLRSKGIRVTCVEFTFFQSREGTSLISQDIVVGKEPAKTRDITSASAPAVTPTAFMKSLDENGRAVHGRLLQIAKDHELPVHWGVKGYSMNVDLDGNHVALCFGYPPDSVRKQSIYTALMGWSGITGKTAAPEDEVKALWAEAEATGLFRPTGRELKCAIDRSLTEKEIATLVSWLDKVANTIRRFGAKE